MEILLNKFKSKRSKNINYNLATNLIGSKKLLPQSPFFDTINEMEIYNEERVNCNLIRLNCIINPICSNMLFNTITEIIKDEGDPNGVKVLNYGVNDGYVHRNDFDGNIFCKNSDVFMYGEAKEGIRDTQISSIKCGYKYFCGIDIFNNHILRNRTFKTVCFNETKNSEFNTINDWMRDENGLNIIGQSYGKTLEKQHLYTTDDVETYENTIDNRLIEHNGWFGFTNIGKFAVVDNHNETMDIFRVINYRKSCDFIQMYPTSDLWSFTPKYNSYLHRLEKNWNYCLTYPSSSTTQNISFINEKTNSLRIMYIDDRVTLKNGIKAFKIYSVSKHGLKKGDYINFYQNDELILKNCEVREIENDYIFYIFSSGLKLSTRWYELTRADTDTTGIDDFFIKIPVSLENAYVTYNDTEYSGETITIKSEEPLTKNNFPLDFNQTWKTKKFHGKEYKLIFDGGRAINLDPLDSSETKVNETDITYDLSCKKTINENSYEYTLQNFVVNMRMRYIISSDRKMVYCGEGEDKATYYLIDNKAVNIDDNSQNFSFKKVVDGEELKYYVRIFSRLPNWKGCEVKIDEHQLYGTNKNLISKYQTLDYEFENHISQLAFAKNIYGDDISQIVFTDDIDISLLRDNLGRPLTSIYLTILKNNKGYKEWYGKNGSKIEIRKKKTDNDEDYHIEYSHCFGMLNCAFRLSKESLPNIDYNNSMQLNNVDSSYQFQGLNMEELQHSNIIYEKILNNNIIDQEKDDEAIQNKSYRARFKEILDDEIQYGYYIDKTKSLKPYKGDTHFYGDLCAYSNKRLIEEPIQQIEMRFNTAQREISSLDKSFQYFKTLYYDEIKSDDLDRDGFMSVENEVYAANQHREGYCYHPHYEIPIKTFDKKISYSQSIVMTLNKIEAVSNEEERAMRFKMKTLNPHKLQINDILYMKYNSYDIITNNISKTYYYTCQVSDIISDKIFECIVYDENQKRINALNTINILSYRLFKRDSTIPSYATFAKDDTCRFMWRNVLNNGFDAESDIENYPFFNGAFYVSKQINLFVKRQDPHEYTKLQKGGFIQDVQPKLLKFIEEDNYYTENDISC